MKMKGRMMLLLTLIVAVALSAISYKGIGSKKALSVHRIEQGLDLSGGVDIVYEADQKSVTDDEMKAAISLLQGRLDWKGWTEAEVAREGDKRIRVQIPGVEDAEEAIQEIGQTAQLSFADEDGNVLLPQAKTVLLSPMLHWSSTKRGRKDLLRQPRTILVSRFILLWIMR